MCAEAATRANQSHSNCSAVAATADHTTVLCSLQGWLSRQHRTWSRQPMLGSCHSNINISSLLTQLAAQEQVPKSVVGYDSAVRRKNMYSASLGTSAEASTTAITCPHAAQHTYAEQSCDARVWPQPPKESQRDPSHGDYSQTDKTALHQDRLALLNLVHH